MLKVIRQCGLSNFTTTRENLGGIAMQRKGRQRTERFTELELGNREDKLPLAFPQGGVVRKSLHISFREGSDKAGAMFRAHSAAHTSPEAISKKVDSPQRISRVSSSGGGARPPLSPSDVVPSSPGESVRPTGPPMEPDEQAGVMSLFGAA